MINKNLLESYIKLNSIQKQKSNSEFIINGDYNLNNSVSSSNNKIISQILDSTTTEIDSSSIIQNNPKFPSKSLKIVSSESFEIKSYYKNINILSNGNMIKNIQYKDYIENILKKCINKSVSNKNSSKLFISSISIKSKKEKLLGESLGQTEIKKINENTVSSEDNILSSNLKNNNILLEETKKLSNKIINNKTEKSSDKNTGMKNKNSSKKELENINKIKSSNFKLNSIENNKNTESNYFNKIKRDNNIKKGINNNIGNNDMNNKSLKSSSLNTFKENDKFYNTLKDNKLSILNKHNINISKKNIDDNTLENEKTNKCIIM